MNHPEKKTDAPKRAIAYYRCSTDRQELDAQKKDVVAVCKANGWKIVGSFEDDGVSSRKKRPGVEAALDAMNRGEADLLVVQRLDRIARSVIELATIADKMSNSGWSIAAGGKVFEKTAEGKAFYGMVSVFAAYEKDLISDRTKSALAAKREQGIIGGRRPIDPEISEAIIDARVNKGLTLQQICDQLNEQGISTPQGGSVWRPSSLTKLFERHGLVKKHKPKRRKSVK